MLTTLLLCLVCFRVDGLVYRRHGLKHHADLENTVCPTQEILGTQSEDTRIHCSVMCAQNNECRRFMYNDDLKECVLCRGKYFSTQEFRSVSGYRHYSDQTRNYHLKCTSDSDCNENNNVCEENLHLCVCTPGYSYHPGKMSCLAGCETYGNTFEIYTQHHLLGNDDDVRACDSLDTCKQYCISALFLCRSFERNNHTAWYSKENALTNPENYTKAGGLVEIYYYNRNCAK